MSRLKYVFVVLISMLFALPSFSADNGCLVYIGTYTGRKSQGIYVARFDAATGKMSEPQLAAASPNPSFLAFSPNGRCLYAANEVGDGAVSAFSIDSQTGLLTALNKQSSKGNSPCHLSVDAKGKNLLVANYVDGTIAVLPTGADGSLSPAACVIQHTGSSVDQSRQQGPHAHWIESDPKNRFVLACDLGIDKVLAYTFDPEKHVLATNAPAFASVKAGSGPRHLAFHPSSQFAYVISEMASTVTAFTYDTQGGALKEIQTISTLPEDFKGRSSTAEIAIHPSGRFLYGSNRGHDSIVVYAVDEKTGKLTLVEHTKTQGRTPRSFGIDPAGQWLIAANQSSDNLVIFKIDPTSGKLTASGQTVATGSPVCVKFLPLK